ncbi:MAG: hypothetical protein HND58_15125 [Planctomycetota bacterium]|nr:MAG: hypothetical protein HND58_15125 [Planctomycetota bacterium]
MNNKDRLATAAILPIALIQVAISLLFSFGPVVFAIWIVFWSDWHWFLVILACLFLGPIALGAAVMLFALLGSLLSQ